MYTIGYYAETNIAQIRCPRPRRHPVTSSAVTRASNQRFRSPRRFTIASSCERYDQIDVTLTALWTIINVVDLTSSAVCRVLLDV